MCCVRNLTGRGEPEDPQKSLNLSAPKNQTSRKTPRRWSPRPVPVSDRELSLSCVGAAAPAQRVLAVAKWRRGEEEEGRKLEVSTINGPAFLFPRLSICSLALGFC
jgi:hypothetical protein